MATGKTKRLGEVLVEEGIISLEQLQQALDKQKETSKSLGATLVVLGFITEDALYHFLAIQHGLEYIETTGIQASPDLLKICPEAAARRLQVFPIKREGNKISIVTASPENPALLHLEYDL